jgi:hypothetical protein
VEETVSADGAGSMLLRALSLDVMFAIGAEVGITIPPWVTREGAGDENLDPTDGVGERNFDLCLYLSFEFVG